MLNRSVKTISTAIVGIPGVGPALRHLKYKIFPKPVFTTSAEYWERQYASGGNSGEGSYNAPAKFKATILNAFIHDQSIKSVIEWGCGDGNQLSLAVYPNYVGIDVSRTAVSMCRRRFSGDRTKLFFNSYEVSTTTQSAECALSLDVIYHLTEDDVYSAYMTRLFASATRYVVIYAWDVDNDWPGDRHVRHRAFLKWIEKNIDGWGLVKTVQHDDEIEKSNAVFANFYFFARQSFDSIGD